MISLRSRDRTPPAWLHLPRRQNIQKRAATASVPVQKNMGLAVIEDHWVNIPKGYAAIDIQAPEIHARTNVVHDSLGGEG